MTDSFTDSSFHREKNILVENLYCFADLHSFEPTQHLASFSEKNINFYTHSKANRYYKVCFYPLCMNRSYNYPWSSDWSKGLSPKEKIIWMYPGNVSNLFLFNKHLVFCFESWEISIVLLVVSYKRSHQNFLKCQNMSNFKKCFQISIKNGRKLMDQ